MSARGIRNNNPGNIRLNAHVHWLGQSDEQTDGSFVQFDKPEYGIRAICRIMRSYKRQGIDTLDDAINRWAPPSENDTTAYVNAVCKGCGKEPSEPVDFDLIMPQLISAIIWHENGDNPYTLDQINAGVALA